MVNLVEGPPEKLGFVSIAMPPIINKGGEKVDDQGGGPVAAVLLQMEERGVSEPSIPGVAGENGNSELDRIDQDNSSPPPLDPRKFHGGPQSFRDDAPGGNPKDNQHVHAEPSSSFSDSCNR